MNSDSQNATKSQSQSFDPGLSLRIAQALVLLAAALVAFIYATGVLISNLSLGQIGGIEGSLPRERYVAIGATYFLNLLLWLFPFTSAYFIWKGYAWLVEVKWKLKGLTVLGFSARTALAAVTLVSAVLTIKVYIWQYLLGDFRFWSLWLWIWGFSNLLVYVFAARLVHFVLLFSRLAWRGQGPSGELEVLLRFDRVATNVVFLVGVIIGSLFTYARDVFPQARREFGGGTEVSVIFEVVSEGTSTSDESNSLQGVGIAPPNGRSGFWSLPQPFISGELIEATSEAYLFKLSDDPKGAIHSLPRSRVVAVSFPDAETLSSERSARPRH